MKLTGFLFAAALLGACTQPAAEENYTRHVDPKIGTGGHGHVFVGANVPFGLVQVGPTSIPQTWDWCSGYHASDSTVIGFSHTHLSGTGIGDLFDITVMPVVGEPGLGPVVLRRPYAGDHETRLLLGSACALRHYGRADGHGARGSAPLHVPGVGRRSRGLRSGERRLLGQGHRYGLPLLGRQHAHRRMALLDGVGQKSGGLLRGRVFKTREGDFLPAAGRDRRFQNAPDRGPLCTCGLRHGGGRTGARESGPFARKYRRREGKPCGGTPRMGFRRYGGRCRQGVEPRRPAGFSIRPFTIR